MKKSILIAGILLIFSSCAIKNQGFSYLAEMLVRVNTLKSFISQEPSYSGNPIIDRFANSVFNSSKQSVSISEQLINIVKGEKPSLLELMTLAGKVKEQTTLLSSISDLMGSASNTLDNTKDPDELSTLTDLFNSAKDANSVLTEETDTQTKLLDLLIDQIKK